MKEKINKYLLQIEKERNIKILLACETGSRAWGFPSPDSDYDVRLIYMHPLDWYLNLTEKKDTIELMLEDGEIDITGWDIRKALRLLKKSNASLLERIQSPQIYFADASFLNEIQPLANSCYSRISTMHHYLSLTKRFYWEINDSTDFKLKSFFYALRCAVACRWILQEKDMPPIEFEKMLDKISLSKRLHERIVHLIQLKATKSESYRHGGEEKLISFIQESIQLAKESSLNLPGAKGNDEGLNLFFKKMIRGYDN